MKSDVDPKPTFYASRRWIMWCNVFISVVAVLGLMVMANYLAAGKYKLELKDKDFIAFESNGHTEVFFKNQLAEIDLEPLLRRDTTEVKRKAFLGETHFSAALLSLAYPRSLKAYFLEGHNEQDPTS